MKISIKKKSIVSLTISVGLLVGGISYHKHTSDEINKLSGDISNKNMTIFEKNNLLMKNNQYISELENKIKTLKKDKKDINNKFNEKQKEVESLKRKMKTLEQRRRNSEKNTIEATATAYTAFCDTGCVGITKTGKPVADTVYEKGRRVVAVDPSVIPLYSKLKIETDNGTFDAIALDTGSKIKNKRIDILMESHDKAISFGKQNVKVTIIQ